MLMLFLLACGPWVTAEPTVPGGPTADEPAAVGSPAATEPGDAANPTAAPPTATATPPGCTLDSGYVADVTVPDDTPFPPNTPFVKTWRLRNSGDCDWESGSQLVYVSGDPLGGPTSVGVPATAVGANVDISVNFSSPGSPGTYRSNWQMQNPDGTLFGDQIYVQIVVPEPTATPTDTPPPPPPTDTPVPATSPPPQYDWLLYRYGDTGPVVYAIQYLLISKGYALTADGIFGPQTRSAVNSLQGSEGLTVDGIVGPNTWQALVQGNTVSTGSTGYAVRAVQYLLHHLHGYTDVAVDGSFGPATAGAVQAFQQSAGLTADGIVGHNTWKALQTP
jgi:peptidoglycan hydrolase-like protein with peptidoglycan-binding domain